MISSGTGSPPLVGRARRHVHRATLVNASKEMFPTRYDFHRTWGPSLVSASHHGAIMRAGGDTFMVLAMIPVVVQWLRNEAERSQLDSELDTTAAIGQ